MEPLDPSLNPPTPRPHGHAIDKESPLTAWDVERKTGGSLVGHDVCPQEESKRFPFEKPGKGGKGQALFDYFVANPLPGRSCQSRDLFAFLGGPQPLESSSRRGRWRDMKPKKSPKITIELFFFWCRPDTLAAMPTRSLRGCAKPWKGAYASLPGNNCLRGVPVQTFLGRCSQVRTTSLCEVKHANANLPMQDFLEQPMRTAYQTTSPTRIVYAVPPHTSCLRLCPRETAK